ncbi:hypothetical protein ES288_D07G004800v1 [Gossypium darwinii]|uniref:Uncharacterized protein n=2 Tax=Gossypium TaxID=3633 RepID=A0A5D2K4F4_GOSTO|nr:hypothetical protein ES288_D07G004800v1 [Gossypium darwinii]TYH60873.1 hypothetical protein ES332_D07G009600v1 [Gossypium tomentosum]
MCHIKLFKTHHSPNLLRQTKTITETGELPKLSASKSLSKSSLGTVPSNSLNLKSKNLSKGSLRITSGNLPANRLLLRSNSNISFNFINLCGTVPQNRFDNPSSSGKYPAISPWFKSIPATVLILLLSSAGAQ